VSRNTHQYCKGEVSLGVHCSSLLEGVLYHKTHTSWPTGRSVLSHSAHSTGGGQWRQSYGGITHVASYES